MTNNGQSGPPSPKIAQTTTPNPVAADGGDMTAEDRRQQVLTVLEAAGVALRSVDVFRACRLRGATFARRSTKTYLAQLVESGDVIKVDSDALNDGELIEIDTAERGHFIAASVADELRD